MFDVNIYLVTLASVRLVRKVFFGFFFGMLHSSASFPSFMAL